MANNFRDIAGFTPNRFIAKDPAGNDSNDGLTKDTPKASIILTTSAIQQIGAGVYTNQGSPLAFEYRLVGDGVVIIKNSEFRGNSIRLVRLDKLRIESSTIICLANSNGHEINNCVIKNNLGSLFLESTNSNGKITNSIFINCLFDQDQQTALVDKSIFVSTTYYSAGSRNIRNNFFDTDSEIIFTVNQSNPSASFINNNINGLITFLGSLYGDATQRSYAIQDQLTGTPQDNGYAAGVNWLTEAQLTADGYTGTVAGWDAAIATCINRDPSFNNDSLEDYSLQSDSPHIGAATDGLNIGGTNVRTSILVTDNGVGDIEIIPSPEIDTSLVSSYRLDTGQVQGYTDFITKLANVSIKVGVIDILAALNFNSSSAGGTVDNNNVPDSEPLTSEYPDKLTTTSAAANTTTLEVTAHGRSVGEFVRVLGEDREITAVTTDQITVGTAFRAIIGSGVTFQVGTENQLKALRPNRLTFQIRTSNQSSKPTLDSQWDNDIDPIYGMAGQFLTIENGTQPKYYIDVDDNVYGGGDSELPTGLTANEISAIWVQVRVYLRNNYES